MFRYLERRSECQWVTITIDGERTDAYAAETVAAAMLRAGHISFRTTAVTGEPRGPYCLMGACFDCLVAIDDVPNQQACMTLVRAGMRVERQKGTADILHLADLKRGSAP